MLFVSVILLKIQILFYQCYLHVFFRKSYKFSNTVIITDIWFKMLYLVSYPNHILRFYLCFCNKSVKSSAVFSNVAKKIHKVEVNLCEKIHQKNKLISKLLHYDNIRFLLQYISSNIDTLLYILFMSFIFFCHLKLAMKADISENVTKNT